MKKINVAVVGYGNIGQYVVEALREAPDCEIAGIVRRSTANSPLEIQEFNVVTSLDQLENVDVAILCSPSRQVEEDAAKALALGINTVDSFDIHSEICGYRTRLNEVAKANSGVSIIAAGWDPGSDSVIRAVIKACMPKGIIYTNFGPGMSMGHTVAVKAVEGVRAAISMTIPKGTGLHRRMVYIELVEGYNFDEVAAKIKADAYFVNDETYVTLVDSVDELLDMGHGVNMTAKGVSGQTHGQRFEFNMAINNPALTAQVLVSSARATMAQRPGAYTMIEVAPIDFLYGDRDALIHDLV